MLLDTFKWLRYTLASAATAVVASVEVLDALSARAVAVLGGHPVATARTPSGYVATLDDKRLVLVRDQLVGVNVGVESEEGVCGEVLARVSTRRRARTLGVSVDTRLLLVVARDGYVQPACCTRRTCAMVAMQHPFRGLAQRTHGVARHCRSATFLPVYDTAPPHRFGNAVASIPAGTRHVVDCHMSAVFARRVFRVVDGGPSKCLLTLETWKIGDKALKIASSASPPVTLDTFRSVRRLGASWTAA